MNKMIIAMALLLASAQVSAEQKEYPSEYLGKIGNRHVYTFTTPDGDRCVMALMWGDGLALQCDFKDKQ